MLLDLLDDDLARGELVVARDDRDLLGELRQEDALFAGRVAAADDQHVLAAVEGAVAGGAEVDAGADEVLLAGDAEPAVGRAEREQDRPGAVLRAVGRAHDSDTRPSTLDLDDFLRREDLDAEALGLARAGGRRTRRR